MASIVFQVEECSDRAGECIHGDCVDTVDSHTCVCYDGYRGDKCDTGKFNLMKNVAQGF